MNELLAPAGNRESAIVAINHGADAVYLGYSAFSARAAAGMSESDLAEVIRYAHCFGAKVYVAMNTLVKDAELSDFISAFERLCSLGTDAFILQDPYLGKYLHAALPDVRLHLSTQAGVNNADGALVAKECGFSRVILARETALSEIRSVCSVLETEVFVQGALCTCLSGQCYFSSFVGGNSGNRGRCKQPCRKRYTYLGNEEELSGCVLSLSDLSVGSDLQRLIEAGVVSFKIEGRLRRAEYVAAAVDYYRALLDGRDPKPAFHALRRAYNRGNYTRGLAFGQEDTLISDRIQGHIGEEIGVLSRRGTRWFCRSAERGEAGDAYKLVRDGREVCGAEFLENAADGLFLRVGAPAREGDRVRITTDASLSALLRRERKRAVSFALEFAEGRPPVAFVDGAEVIGDAPIQSARSAPLTEADVLHCFQKTDAYPFAPELSVRIAGRCFLPKAELNAFRRKVYARLYAEPLRPILQPIALPALPPTGTGGRIAVLGGEFDFAGKVDWLVFKPFDYGDDGEFERFFAFAREHAKHTALWIPAFYNDADRALLLSRAAGFSHFYGEGLGALRLAERCGKAWFAGTGLNLSNRIQTAAQAGEYALSKELNFAEQRPLGGFVQTAGSLKLMDLSYCPFRKRCDRCNRRNFYVLRDEDGREFPVRRYRLSSCRFEVYNCASLVSVQTFADVLLDFTLVDNQTEVLESLSSLARLKSALPNHTAGHTQHSVL